MMNRDKKYHVSQENVRRQIVDILRFQIST